MQKEIFKIETSQWCRHSFDFERSDSLIKSNKVGLTMFLTSRQDLKLWLSRTPMEYENPALRDMSQSLKIVRIRNHHKRRQELVRSRSKQTRSRSHSHHGLQQLESYQRSRRRVACFRQYLGKTQSFLFLFLCLGDDIVGFSSLTLDTFFGTNQSLICDFLVTRPKVVASIRPSGRGPSAMIVCLLNLPSIKMRLLS